MQHALKQVFKDVTQRGFAKPFPPSVVLVLTSGRLSVDEASSLGSFFVISTYVSLKESVAVFVGAGYAGVRISRVCWVHKDTCSCKASSSNSFLDRLAHDTHPFWSPVCLLC